jgi:hypothetical protein
MTVIKLTHARYYALRKLLYCRLDSEQAIRRKAVVVHVYDVKSEVSSSYSPP